MTKHAVAVITRTKDRPTFLARALVSVGSQTFTDYVHVVINDGGNPEAVEKLVDTLSVQQKNRTVLIHNKISSGMEAASNKAIAAVDSTLIAIHDDDDSWHPEMLVRVSNRIAESGAQGVVVRTDKITEELNAEGDVVHKKTEQWLPDVKAINLYRQCIDNQMTPITFVYARQAYEAVGVYDETLPVCGDWDFGIRFLLKYDVDFLDPGFALANYHHRKFVPNAEGNTSFSGTDKHRYYSNLLMNKFLRQELANGKFGIGYIMSDLRYKESYTAKLVAGVLPGFAVNLLKRRVRK